MKNQRQFDYLSRELDTDYLRRAATLQAEDLQKYGEFESILIMKIAARSLGGYPRNDIDFDTFFDAVEMELNELEYQDLIEQAKEELKELFTSI